MKDSDGNIECGDLFECASCGVARPSPPTAAKPVFVCQKMDELSFLDVSASDKYISGIDEMIKVPLDSTGERIGTICVCDCLNWHFLASRGKMMWLHSKFVDLDDSGCETALICRECQSKLKKCRIVSSA